MGRQVHCLKSGISSGEEQKEEDEEEPFWEDNNKEATKKTFHSGEQLLSRGLCLQFGRPFTWPIPAAEAAEAEILSCICRCSSIVVVRFGCVDRQSLELFLERRGRKRKHNGHYTPILINFIYSSLPRTRTRKLTTTTLLLLLLYTYMG